MSAQPWKRIKPTTVQKVGWRTIVTKTFQLPNGRTDQFQLYDVEGREFAAVVALTSDNQVVVARQFRPGPEKIMDELPGGFPDAEDNGDVLKTAVRELQEETGYRPAAVTYLGKAYKDAYNNAVWHYCLATGCERISDLEAHDEVEAGGLEITLISIEQLIRNALNGGMTDADGVLLAYEILRDIQQSKK